MKFFSARRLLMSCEGLVLIARIFSAIVLMLSPPTLCPRNSNCEDSDQPLTSYGEPAMWLHKSCSHGSVCHPSRPDIHVVEYQPPLPQCKRGWGTAHAKAEDFKLPQPSASSDSSLLSGFRASAHLPILWRSRMCHKEKSRGSSKLGRLSWSDCLVVSSRRTSSLNYFLSIITTRKTHGLSDGSPLYLVNYASSGLVHQGKAARLYWPCSTSVNFVLRQV